MSNNNNNNNNKGLVAVTGATGFVGTYIVKLLLEKGYNVLALVRDPTNEEKLKTLKSFEKSGIDEAAQSGGGGGKLTFAGGELEKVDYNSVLQNVDYVMHVASPFLYTSEDPVRDIINPAINGTISVLKACSQINSIKKVIVTSSGLAVVDLQNMKDEFKDDDWSNPPISLPYPYSKVQAEKAAWEFIKENNLNESTNHFKLVVMNPTFILGPALSPTLINSSVQSIIKQLFNGVQPQNFAIGVVNVLNVAQAHILAMESSDADNQRITINQSVVPFKTFAQIAMKLFPQFKYNPNIPTDQPEPFIYKLKSSKLEKLGLTEFIPLEKTIKDMINHLLDSKLITPELL